MEKMQESESVILVQEKFEQPAAKIAPTAATFVFL